MSFILADSRKFARYFFFHIATREQSSVSMKAIGTHSGCFQADEALGIFLLRQIKRFATLPLVRTRDLEKLAPLEIVIDVGGEYDHEKLRYDHHQRGFSETFNAKRDTKLSACGLVYKHYGREVLASLYPQLTTSTDQLEWVYEKVYKGFVEAIDAIDNGVEVCDGPKRWRDNSGLSARVGRLNSRWNEPEGGPTEDERFEAASAVCGADFTTFVAGVVESELPARELVEAALLARDTVDPSGKLLTFESGGMPWKTHLYELERKHAIGGAVSFVLYADSSGMWRVQAVTVEGTDFTNRVSLPEAWRGVREQPLVDVSGIPGGRFCHAGGFICGNDTYEGALAMARAACAQA